jgi:hypothetical protein
LLHKRCPVAFAVLAGELSHRRASLKRYKQIAKDFLESLGGNAVAPLGSSCRPQTRRGRLPRRRRTPRAENHCRSQYASARGLRQRLSELHRGESAAGARNCRRPILNATTSLLYARRCTSVGGVLMMTSGCSTHNRHCSSVKFRFQARLRPGCRVRPAQLLLLERGFLP